MTTNEPGEVQSDLAIPIITPSSHHLSPSIAATNLTPDYRMTVAFSILLMLDLGIPFQPPAG